jgi:hypothetical protein
MAEVPLLNDNKNDIQKRVARLEESFEKLFGLINKIPKKNIVTRILTDDLPAKKEGLRQADFWLNKIGVGLLLFGVAYFFKYSLEQGWFSHALQVLLDFSFGFPGQSERHPPSHVINIFH